VRVAQHISNRDLGVPGSYHVPPLATRAQGEVGITGQRTHLAETGQPTPSFLEGGDLPPFDPAGRA
jgi:hypothetical protein